MKACQASLYVEFLKCAVGAFPWQAGAPHLSRHAEHMRMQKYTTAVDSFGNVKQVELDWPRWDYFFKILFLLLVQWPKEQNITFPWLNVAHWPFLISHLFGVITPATRSSCLRSALQYSQNCPIMDKQKSHGPGWLRLNQKTATQTR